MKVEPKELRIGNLVKCKPISIPRLDISSDGIMSITGYGVSVLESDTNNNLGWEAIELTEDWLMKMPQLVLVTNHRYYFQGHGNQYMVRISKTGGRLYIGASHAIPVYSVHEFQNAFNFLTQTELIFKG